MDIFISIEKNEMEALENILNTIKGQNFTKDVYKACPYSVSRIVETLKEPFDADAVAKKTFLKRFEDEKSVYYHMSVDEIKAMWAKNADEGKLNGKLLDQYIGYTLEPGPDTAGIKQKFLSSIDDIPKRKCMMFDDFYQKNISGKLSYVCRETLLLDMRHKINGRLDALFTAGDTVILIDWKNTADIKTSNSFAKLKGPLYNYDMCDLNTYSIQLYLYKYMLKNIYGIENQIVPMIVRIGEKDFGIYQPQIPYSDSLIEDVIDFAVNEINIQTERI